MHILHKQELSIFVFKSARCLAHDGGGHIFPDGHPHLDERARGAAREWEWRTRFFFYEEIFFVGKNAVCKINFFQTEPGNAVDARNKSTERSWYTTALQKWTHFFEPLMAMRKCTIAQMR